MRTALEGSSICNYVSHWDLEFHPWHKFTNEPFKIGTEFSSLSTQEKEKQVEVNAGVVAEVAVKLGFSGVTVPGGYWETSPGEPAYYWMPDEYRFRQAGLIRKALPDDILVIAVTGGVMAMPGADNYVSFSYKLFDAPEEIDQMASRMLANGIENIKKARDAGVDAVVTASDLSDNRGPFFSPEQLSRFVMPFLRQWALSAKESELLSIIHTDGNIMPIFDLLCDSGVNAIQAIDPVAGMKMSASLEKSCGRVALCGNLDCGNLVSGTPETVYAEARNLLNECKLYNRFVFGASNAVQNEVPKENYEAAIAALKAFSR